jgi:hypothetical protein
MNYDLNNNLIMSMNIIFTKKIFNLILDLSNIAEFAEIKFFKKQFVIIGVKNDRSILYKLIIKGETVVEYFGKTIMSCDLKILLKAIGENKLSSNNYNIYIENKYPNLLQITNDSGINHSLIIVNTDILTYDIPCKLAHFKIKIDKEKLIKAINSESTTLGSYIKIVSINNKTSSEIICTINNYNIKNVYLKVNIMDILNIYLVENIDMYILEDYPLILSYENENYKIISAICSRL